MSERPVEQPMPMLHKVTIALFAAASVLHGLRGEWWDCATYAYIPALFWAWSVAARRADFLGRFIVYSANRLGEIRRS